MKICAIICEYNPFHNGHLRQLNAAREQSQSDAVLCIMSGNFVQRGQAAIINKHIRAKHAVQAGADAVIELPTPFATSNAEIFAKGAIHILSSIPSIKTLCFGAENADKLAFISAARYLREEPQEISEKIKQEIKSGVSYAKARANAYAGFIPFDLLSAPNNILGLEYTKAILSSNTNIDILPIQRTGAGYLDEELQENYSSASAIRAAIQQGATISGNLPDFVKKDLPSQIDDKLETLEKYAIFERTAQEIASTLDCTEGLENALKRAAESNENVVLGLTSARYTSSRIRRILLQNLLKIDETLIRESLHTPLYLRVLAIKKERNDLLSALSESNFPLLARAHDDSKLNETAKRCFERDLFAERVHNLLYPTPKKETIFI